MKLIPKPEHNSLAWLLGRQKDENGDTIVGGSDAPVLMGDSPYKTRADLFFDKVTPPVVGEFNPVFHRGNVLEAPLVGEAARVLKTSLITPDVMYREGRWNINSDAVDNPTSPSINIECKTTTRYTIGSSDDLPIEWRWQGWAQMAVLNTPVFFSVLDARQNLAVVELERNDYAIDALLTEAEIFCSSIDNGDGLVDHIDELTAEQIARLVRAEPEAVDLPHHALDLIIALEGARQMKKDAEEQEKYARDEIARLLITYEVGTVDDVPVVSWKEQAGKKTVDMAALRAAHPEIVAQFEREGNPYRVMRIIKKKEKAS